MSQNRTNSGSIAIAESQTEALAALNRVTPETVLQVLEAQIPEYASQPVNTLRTLESAWLRWARFACESGWPFFPPTLAQIKAYVEARLKAGKKMNTVRIDLFAIDQLFQCAQLDNPVKSKAGRLMMKGFQNAMRDDRDKRTQLFAEQKHGLSPNQVEAILANMDLSKPIDVRDTALLLLAEVTMLRRAELVALCVEDLTQHEEGGSVRVWFTKTTGADEPIDKEIDAFTWSALTRWLRLSGIRSGPIFRALSQFWKGATVPERPLPAPEVARIFKRRAAQAGIDPRRISGHSLRIGGAQSLIDSGESLATVMHAGNWKSERQAAQYTRRSNAGSSRNAARLSERNRG